MQKFQQVLAKRLSRRKLLTTGAYLGGSAFIVGCKSESMSVTSEKPFQNNSTLVFKELAHGLDEHFSVADGYEYQVLIAWGDPLFADAPIFNPLEQSEQSQLRQFGYNNDFVGFVSLPFSSQNVDRGLLVVNHETTEPRLMFPDSPKSNKLNLDQCKIDIAAHGLSVIEIQKINDKWLVVLDSKYNRRITPNSELQMSGPAAGSERLRTSISRDGIRTLGTYGNCAGGLTPWGTILTAEENVDQFFYGDVNTSEELKNFKSFHVKSGKKNWGKHFERWNLQRNPRELLHVGWVVEIDPFDPQSVPQKRTALGRFKHEAANVHLNRDGRAVVYMGDDEKFQYIYRFISKKNVDTKNREANIGLLDEGELSVARFNEDGSLLWLPMVYAEGPLTEAAGFKSQADVVLDARIAADMLGATPMDRPEDVEVNPVNGRVYVMLTNNSSRKPRQTNKANPRVANQDGQVIEFWPENGDHSTAEFKWDLFLLAGDPARTETSYNPQTSKNGWLSCPDNCAFDKLGNLWLATDGAINRGIADGLWATEVAGKYKALTRRFARTPVGAEMCGPFFTPDSETLFCAVQHPASGSTFNNPQTRWPDFRKDLPPRPAVLAINKIGGGRVGS